MKETLPMTTNGRRRSPSRRRASASAFKAERGDMIALGVVVADGMAMVHDGPGEAWIQSLPADNIEPCSCGGFAGAVRYRVRRAVV